MTGTDEILTSLEPLFEQAHSENLWFYSQSLAGIFWYSPKELRKLHSEGRFIWETVNWQLLPPQQHEEELQTKVGVAQEALEHFRERIKS